MKTLKLLRFFLIFSVISVEVMTSTSLLWAQNGLDWYNYSTKDPIEAAKHLKKVFKYAKDVGGNEEVGSVVTVPQDADLEVQQELCVECDNFIPLGKDVASIISRIAEEEGNPSLKLTSNKFEAVVSYYGIVNEKTGRMDCYEMFTSQYKQGNNQINEDEMLLLFSKDSLEGLKSAQYEMTDQRIVWLRGTGDDDHKLVKVRIDKNEGASLSYYMMVRTDYLVRKEDNEEEIEKQKNSSKKGQYNFGHQTEFESDEGSFLNVHIGPKGEYRYYVPTKLSLIDIKGQVKLMDNLYLDGGVDLNEKRQKAELRLRDKANRTALEAEVKASGKLRVSGHYNLNFNNDSRLNTQAYIEENKRGVSSTYSQGRGSVTTGYVHKSDGSGERMYISSGYQVIEDGSLSLEYEKQGGSKEVLQNGHAVFMTFKMSF